MTQLELLLKELTELRDMHANNVVKGGSDIAVYNFQCGLIQGLTRAEEIIKARAKEAENDE